MDRRAFIGRMAAWPGVARRRPAACSDRPRPARRSSPAPGPTARCWPADANGVQLPAGFTQPRHRPTSGQPVGGHRATRGTSPPTAARASPPPGGGWVYVSNSEVPRVAGGASAVRFLPDGTIDRRLPRSSPAPTRNCAGGPDAVGHVALVRGERRPRAACTSATRSSPARACGATAHGLVRPRGRRRRPGHRPRVPHRGRPRRAPVPLHAHHPGRRSSAGSLVRRQRVGHRRSRGCRSSASAPDRSAGDDRRSTAARARGSPAGTLWFTTKGDGRVWELDLGHPAAHGPLRRLDHGRRPAHRRRQHHRSTRRPATSTWPRTAATSRSASSRPPTPGRGRAVPAPRRPQRLGDHRAGLLARRHPALLQLPARHEREHRRHLRDHRPVPHRRHAAHQPRSSCRGPRPGTRTGGSEAHSSGGRVVTPARWPRARWRTRRRAVARATVDGHAFASLTRSALGDLLTSATAPTPTSTTAPPPPCRSVAPRP